MSDNHMHIIVGLGATAFSCARYFTQHRIPFAVTDTRDNPPRLLAFKKAYPDVPMSFGRLDPEWVKQAAKLVVSPGVSLQEPLVARVAALGVPVVGDIELFAQQVKAPVIAITGTNAKSTVTTLVGEMAKAAGLQAAVGGNLGTPALDLLTGPLPPLFVLELSSFQLETTHSLMPKVASILNITPDHMDRYPDLQAYIAAKQRIYSGCEIAVYNRDDAATACGHRSVRHQLGFTLQVPQQNEFGLLEKNGEKYLAYENQLLLSVRELPILGRHYQANALAALAIGYAFGLPIEPMLKVLTEFKGLPHRCEFVRERNGVTWYNDSKGTNVGATLAAINGLGSEIDGKIILLAGGVGKNADFTSLIPAVSQYVRAVILFGEAAPMMADIFHDHVKTHLVGTMQEAIACADQEAWRDDSVLLSPACASFDMFDNFEHRGRVFIEGVQAL